MSSGKELGVGHLIQPVYDPTIQRRGHRQMGHAGLCRCRVPVPFARHKPDTSPVRIVSTGPLSVKAQPQPAVTISACPQGCVCEAVRARGSKVTLAQETGPDLGRLSSDRCNATGEIFRLACARQ